MSDSLGEAISYRTIVNSTDRPPILNVHCNSNITSSIPYNTEVTDDEVILQDQLQLTSISYRRDEGRIALVDSEFSFCRRKVTDRINSRDSHRIKCVVSGLRVFLSGLQNGGTLDLSGKR